MLRFLGAAALAATLSFGPVAGVGNGSTPLQPIRAVASVPAQQPVAPAAAPRFGLASLRDSGLAPGQSATDFQAWLRRAPGNVIRLIASKNK